MVDRRAFFKKIIPSKEESSPLYLRPPYFEELHAFEKECINCEDKSCALACPEKIIVIETKGTPILNFSKSGCTFCQECAIACKKDVLKVEKEKAINAIFLINKDKCMAHNKSICFSCKEPCIEDAIIFEGLFNPIIDINRCNACGFCYNRCPTNAIEFIIKETE